MVYPDKNDNNMCFLPKDLTFNVGVSKQFLSGYLVPGLMYHILQKFGNFGESTLIRQIIWSNFSQSI